MSELVDQAAAVEPAARCWATWDRLDCDLPLGHWPETEHHAEVEWPEEPPRPLAPVPLESMTGYDWYLAHVYGGLVERYGGRGLDWWNYSGRVE